MNLQDLRRIITDLAGNPHRDRRPLCLGSAVALLRESRCTPDGRHLFPDDLRTLEEIAKEIDEENDPQKAWDLVAHVASTSALTRPSELGELHPALASNLNNCTVAYMDVKTSEVASGTVVEIDKHVFVATVAHSLPPKPHGRISFISFVETPVDKTVAEILGHAKRESERPDVGFLQIDPDFARSVLRKEPIGLDRLLPCGPGKKDFMAYLFGFPTDLIEKKANSPRERSLVFTGQCYMNLPIMPEEWAHVHRSRSEFHQPDPDMDVYLPYPMDEEMLSRGARVKPDLSEPYGLSGGGVWQGPLRDEVWAPEKYKLIAIQSTWPRKGRFLQATQIIHWLKLLWENCEHLRSTLAGAFPALTHD